MQPVSKIPRSVLALGLALLQFTGMGLILYPAGGIFLVLALFAMVGFEGLEWLRNIILILLAITGVTFLAVMGFAMAAWKNFSRGMDKRAAVLSGICFILGVLFFVGYFLLANSKDLSLYL